MPARRVTSMLLGDDVVATAARYEGQGFCVRTTDEPECIGTAEATGTSLMLLGPAYAARSMPAGTVAELQRGAGLNVWVDSLADVSPAGLLGEVETRCGARERYVREAGGLVAYAEQLAS